MTFGDSRDTHWTDKNIFFIIIIVVYCYSSLVLLFCIGFHYPFATTSGKCSPSALPPTLPLSTSLSIGNHRIASLWDKHTSNSPPFRNNKLTGHTSCSVLIYSSCGVFTYVTVFFPHGGIFPFTWQQEVNILI